MKIFLAVMAFGLFVSTAVAVMPHPCYIYLANGKKIEVPCPKPRKCYAPGALNPVEIPCIKPAS